MNADELARRALMRLSGTTPAPQAVHHAAPDIERSIAILTILQDAGALPVLPGNQQDAASAADALRMLKGASDER